MSINPLNDISRVYLEQVAESAVPGKPAERLGAVTLIPKAEQEAARERALAKAKAMREKRGIKEEGQDPFGRPGGKHGGVKKGGGYEKGYAAMKREIEKLDKGEETAAAKRYKETRNEEFVDPEHGEAPSGRSPLQNVSDHPKASVRKKAVRGFRSQMEKEYGGKWKSRSNDPVKEALDPVGKEDADPDNDGKKNTKADKYLLNRRKVRGQAISVRKEGFSNWREDLSEVISAEIADKEIKERKGINNKIKTSAVGSGIKLGEAVENLGGTLIEMVEIDEVDYIVESVYDELLDEGYEEDDIEEAIEYALTEATVTFGHDTPTGQKKKGNLLKAVGRLARQKLSSKVRGARTAATSAVARGARKVAKGALGVARKIEGDKKPSGVHSKPGVRTASTYSGAGSGQKERVSSGSYQAPATTKKKAEKPSDPWKGSESVPQKPKPKAKVKPSDPWRGSETVPPKEKTKKAAAPKATTTPKAKAKATATAPKRRRKSKLDDLLASVRADESVNLGEKVLTTAEKKKKEELLMSMKKKLPDFEARYPGRGENVMHAIATTMAKRMAEDIAIGGPSLTPTPTSSGVSQQSAQQASKLSAQQKRLLQQKKQQELLILQKKMQGLRSTQGIDPGITV
jgi:hypothetical protein